VNSALSPSKLGVGVPWIGAIRGAESGSWARWHVKHPLHLSSDPANTPQPDIRSPNPSLDASAAELTAPSAASDAAGMTPPSVFTTALAMLLYNVAYAAHTQALDVPLAGVGDALGNLWALCCAPALGRRSHETGAPAFSVPMNISAQSSGIGGANTGGAVESGMPGMGALLASELGVGTGAGPSNTAFVVTAPSLGSRLPSTIGVGVGVGSGLPPVLPPPTPPGFPLDFAQVLQATAAGPRRAHRDNRGTVKRGKDDDKGRDKRKVEKAANAIAEEDEWDLVEAEAL
jgi:hypothetical protein